MRKKGAEDKILPAAFKLNGQVRAGRLNGSAKSVMLSRWEANTPTGLHNLSGICTLPVHVFLTAFIPSICRRKLQYFLFLILKKPVYYFYVVV